MTARPVSPLSLRLLPVLACLLIGVGLAPAMPATAATAKAAAPSDPETFFGAFDLNIVNVEVFVTDKGGRFIPGLTKDDFEITEDGKPVEITNFYAATGAEPASPPASSESAAPLPAEQSLSLTLFFDNQTLIPSDRNRVLQELRTFVRDRLKPGDRVMVVSYDGPGRLKIWQPATGDKAAVLAALDGIAATAAGGFDRVVELRQALTTVSQGDTFAEASDGPTVGGGPERQEASAATAEASYEGIRLYAEARYQEIRSSLATLGHFVDALSGLPGRKAVLFVSGGMSLRPAQALFDVYQSKFGSIARRVGIQITLEAFQTDTTTQFREIGERANANRITFYSLGLPSTPTQSGDLLWSRFQETLETMNLTQSLVLVTAPTGGLADFDPNRASSLLERMRYDFDHYYSLGYAAPPRQRAGNHRIEVKVKRPGLKARHRESFHDRSSRDRLNHQTMAALLFEAGNDNPLGVELLVDGERAAPQPGKREVSLLVTFPMAKLVLLPQDQFHEGKVTVMVGARDDQGRTSDLLQVNVPVRVPNAQMSQAQDQTVAYRATLLLRNIAHTLVVSVRDEYGNVDSTITAPYAAATASSTPGR
ncbi:MAG TPA: VWA domain-containing protein [Thermoanaerobaculia bacterium]|nr:VWA domain-containing protein [Thermoanaerobaculia bacterium]